MKLIKSATLHSTLHKSETLLHPVYFATVAVFGHGAYTVAAGVLAVITLLLLVVVEP